MGRHGCRLQIAGTGENRAPLRRVRARRGESALPRARVEAAAGGAGLLWRVKSSLRPPRETALADGSSPTMIHASPKERRHRVNGRRVRVVECRLEGPAAKEPLQRLMTTILRAFPSRPPASTRPLPSAS
jgi:hypothetical protein